MRIIHLNITRNTKYHIGRISQQCMLCPILASSNIAVRQKIHRQLLDVNQNITRKTLLQIFCKIVRNTKDLVKSI